MSHLLDRLNFLQSRELEQFSDGHGQVTREDRDWEDTYRNRWRHDKVVRSTHGVNCTGSCSWKIYVKSGIVTWETQQTDYPRTRPDLPNHEPRGCSRGASYSWYMYSANRVKYPLVRSRLIKAWREARATLAPVAAWQSIVEDPVKRASYMKKRGHGGFVRAEWDEITEIIANSPAEEYGLRVGDVLTAMNGMGMEELEKNWAELKKQMTPGKTVTYAVDRGGKTKQMDITLAEMPESVLAQWVGKHMLEHASVEVASK